MIELRAIVYRDAGDFHRDGWRRRGAQLAHACSLRDLWRAFEPLRQQALHFVPELSAEREKRPLGAVPRNQAGGIDTSEQVAHDVNPRRTGHSGRGNVYGDKDRAALRIGHGGAVVKGRVFVSLARLDDLEAAGFERGANLCGELQHDIAFVQAPGTPRAQVRASVSWVEHHNICAGALDRRTCLGTGSTRRSTGRWLRRRGRIQCWLLCRLLAKGERHATQRKQ